MKSKTCKRQLYLIAQGQADKSAPVLNDMKRPLSPKGVCAMLNLLEEIKERKLPCPDLILCSSGLCARQSLDLLYEAYSTCDVVFKDSLYGAIDYRIFDVVKVLDDILYRVMILTEDTALTTFMNYITVKENKIKQKLMPASCAVVSLSPNTSWHMLGPSKACVSDFF
ncbi:MAG: hypothetical protein J6Y85_03585 [Alphaproteobacteria bacterium]|nr:hypothetical protein [Alphaproteobacteria bacterium]